MLRFIIPEKTMILSHIRNKNTYHKYHNFRIHTMFTLVSEHFDVHLIAILVEKNIYMITSVPLVMCG